MLFPTDKVDFDLPSEELFRKGILYYYGYKDTDIDLEKAYIYFLLANRQQEPRATYMIGKMYEQGLYVLKSFQNAKIFYEKAANLGVYEAYQRLIWIHSFSSFDLVKNFPASISWGKLGLQQGFHLLHIDLGKLYYYCIKDYPKAIYHFQHAFYGHDIAEGAYFIAKMYDQGKGVKKSKSISRNFMLRSAKKGNERAQKFLSANIKAVYT